MKLRTKRFALEIIRLVASLPKTIEARVVGNQLIRSGTSVGANYRAACREKQPGLKMRLSQTRKSQIKNQKPEMR